MSLLGKKGTFSDLSLWFVEKVSIFSILIRWTKTTSSWIWLYFLLERFRRIRHHQGLFPNNFVQSSKCLDQSQEEVVDELLVSYHLSEETSNQKYYSCNQDAGCEHGNNRNRRKKSNPCDILWINTTRDQLFTFRYVLFSKNARVHNTIWQLKMDFRNSVSVTINKAIIPLLTRKRKRSWSLFVIANRQYGNRN